MRRSSVSRLAFESSVRTGQSRCLIRRQVARGRRQTHQPQTSGDHSSMKCQLESCQSLIRLDQTGVFRNRESHPVELKGRPYRELAGPSRWRQRAVAVIPADRQRQTAIAIWQFRCDHRVQEVRSRILGLQSWPDHHSWS